MFDSLKSSLDELSEHAKFILSLVVVTVTILSVGWYCSKSPSYSVGECVTTRSATFYKVKAVGKYNTYSLKDVYGTETVWSTNIHGSFTRVDCMELFK